MKKTERTYFQQAQTRLALERAKVTKKLLILQRAHRETKAWGWEDVIFNGPQYCGKILHFHKGGTFSLHFHIRKHETWYVAKGSFLLKSIDTDDAERQTRTLVVGDVVVIPPGAPHQLVALEPESEIFEVSTEHFDSDSYRVEAGDSQKGAIT